MGSSTTIQWTDATWNPWRGCTKVSPGCAHCYMFDGQRRYGQDPSRVVRAAPATFDAPLTWARRGCPAAGSLVFTCSWSDWFHEDADVWREEAWGIIRRCPQLTFQVLTKRPERIADHLPAGWGGGWPNVWLGVSIENRRFVGRADVLRQVPAAVRFISAEPLLGPLVYQGGDKFSLRSDGRYAQDWPDGYQGDGLDLTRGIDWMIIGGESGPRARRMRVEWARDLVAACRNERVAPFVKQLGAKLGSELRCGLKGEDMAAWPADLRVREMPKQWRNGGRDETGQGGALAPNLRVVS